MHKIIVWKNISVSYDCLEDLLVAKLLVFVTWMSAAFMLSSQGLPPVALILLCLLAGFLGGVLHGDGG